MSKADRFKVLVPPRSREALAKKIGCSKLHLQRVFRGSVNPSADLARRIVAALNGRITFDELMAEGGARSIAS